MASFIQHEFSNVFLLELFATEIDHDLLGSLPQEKNKQELAMAGAINEKKKKDVNFTNYPGFNPRELTELPGQIETPQLLHRITKAQSFDVSWFDCIL